MSAAEPLRPSEARALRAWLLVLVLLATGPYLAKLGNSYLLWDDPRFIRDDRLMHSLANLPQFFTSAQDGLYRPLRRTLYSVCYDVLGLRQPEGWEAVGILLHLACTLAFFGVARRLTRSLTAAGIAGAVFAAHPVHVERVAGITASFDLLGDGLLLLAVYLYLRPPGDRPVGWTARWAAALLAALFSSEMAGIFLPLILVIDFVRTHSWWNRLRVRWWSYAVGLAVTAVYAYCRVTLVGQIGRGTPRPAAGVLDNLLTVCTTYVYYLRLFVCPWQANYFHFVPVAAPGARLVGVLSLAGTIALLLGALWWRRRRPGLAMAILWFFVCLLPFSQILPNQPVFQERYAYLPLGGFALALGVLGASLFERTTARRRLLVGAGAAYLLLLAVLTAQYTRDFHDDISLWSRVLRREPTHAGALNNVGTALLQRGRQAEAVNYFRRARAADPNFTLAFRNEASALLALQRYPEALSAIEGYLTLVPTDREGMMQRWATLMQMEKRAQVIEEVRPIVESGVREVPLLQLLAMAYYQSGDGARGDQIVAALKQAHPNDPQVAQFARHARETFLQKKPAGAKPNGN